MRHPILTVNRGFAGKQYFITQQGQGTMGYCISLNTPTAFAENCLLLAVGSRHIKKSLS
jgi:hypothetical protein